MASSGMIRRVALVRTDDWEELNASIIRVTTIGERQILQEPHTVKSQKTPIFSKVIV
jgi:hypothetical protein